MIATMHQQLGTMRRDRHSLVALDQQRPFDSDAEPDGCQWPPEAGDQLVVTPAAEDWPSKAGSHSPEGDAGVLVHAPHFTEIQDHAVGDAVRLQQAVYL